MILSKVNVTEIDLNAETNKKISASSLNTLLIIVPTNRKVRNLKRELIRLSPYGASGKINIETIGSLASKLFFLTENYKSHLLGEAASTVLLNQSFREIKKEYFGNYKDEIPFGTLERVKNVISEYKRHGISPDSLSAEAKKLSGSEKSKAEDICRVYKHYVQKCLELNLYETGDVYAELNRLKRDDFENRFRKNFPDADFIIINGFDEFTSPEIEIIDSLADLPDQRLFLWFDYEPSNPAVFSHLDKCYNRLYKKGFKPIREISGLDPGDFRFAARNNLFNRKSPEKDESYSNKIIKISAGTKKEEITLIAKEIKNLILEKKAAPNRIGVVFNLIGEYSPLIRDLFNLYGIPFNLTDRIRLNSSQHVLSLLNFLEILENDFYFKNIFRALSSGFPGLRKPDLSNLINTAVNLKIISGLSNWQSSLKEAIETFAEENEDSTDIRFNRKLNYLKALSDIEAINELLSPFSRNLTPHQFNEKLNELIIRLGIPEGIINNRSADAEADIRSVVVFLDTVKEITDLLALESAPGKKYPLEFYLNHLRTAVSAARFNIKEKPGFGVQVTTLNEIRGLEYDYLFIGGLYDGNLPTRYTPEIFFSGNFMKLERQHQLEERYLFYQALCTWKEALYLTHPCKDERRELVPSNFLQQFSDDFGLIEINEKDFQNYVFSKQEFYELLGTGKLNDDKISEIDKNEISGIPEALRIDKIRTANPFGESEYTGFVTENLSEELINKLSEFRDKQFSISQLETYAKCPFKFYAERILNLEVQEEPSEEFAALEFGSLLHRILYRFYSEISADQIDLKSCTEKEFEKAEKKLFSIAGEEISNVKINAPVTFYEREKILGISGDRSKSILHLFLLNERKPDNTGKPLLFESEFGVFENKSNDQKYFKAGNVKVRGKIDRIDYDETQNLYSVIDYKLSGNKPTAKQLIEGISLQLPLYLFAAADLLKEKTGIEAEPGKVFIYSLKFSRKELGKKMISITQSNKKLSKEELTELNKEMIRYCIDAVEKYVEGITSGKFHLSMHEDRENLVCRYCGFKPVCRISDANF